MSLSDSEREVKRLREWKKRAKGHPTRWRIIRDAVAVLSLGWMSTSQFMIAMRRLWALKNSTSRELLEELESEKAIVQEKDDRGVYTWGATPEGVAFWIRTTKAIPAGVVEAASTSLAVRTLEA
ncbi:hypothetical protein ES703_51748 [subsurface metagenome]